MHASAYSGLVESVIALRQASEDYRETSAVLADACEDAGNLAEAAKWRAVASGRQYIARMCDGKPVLAVAPPAGVALRPGIGWRSRPPYPIPPPSHRLEFYRSAAANVAARRWGVQPEHVDQCTYALWVPIETDDAEGEDTPLRRDARAWLAEGRQAAVHVAEREYPFGRARILAYAEEMGCPVPAAYCGRARDLNEFLATAREETANVAAR